MYALETLRKLNKDDLAEHIEATPLVRVRTAEDAFKAPDYSGVEIADVEALTGLKEVETLFVDSSGFGQEGEPALTVGQFKTKVTELLQRHRTLQACLTGVGQFQVHITFLAKPTKGRVLKTRSV